MSERNAGLTADPLFVGATRPPMRWGVTYSALLFNMVFTLETFLLSKNLLILLLCAPIHGVCMLLCARDPRYFDLLLLWARTRLPALFANLRMWKASSYWPLPLDMPKPGRPLRRLPRIKATRMDRRIEGMFRRARNALRRERIAAERDSLHGARRAANVVEPVRRLAAGVSTGGRQLRKQR